MPSASGDSGRGIWPGSSVVIAARERCSDEKTKGFLGGMVI